ncbi:toxin-antitoxin system, toxin component family protein [Streptomyces sp. NPDC006134]|uniref:toxin-antitoxin system, toxin component family protein n=1 Tax=Streptomyces sp. NPDC006134 TaxID=3154467 RepID=UPI0033CE9E76
MDRAGARGRASRLVAALRRARTGSAMRALAGDLAAAVHARTRPPGDVRAVCRAVCEEMAARRGGRPVELRFERFPDEIDVTGLWVEFHDFDLVIVEERAEAVQQLVILGHELWHLHAGHGHHHVAGPDTDRAPDRVPGRAPGRAPDRVPGRAPGWKGGALPAGLAAALGRGGTPVAARNGSREADEAEADAFGHRLAAAFRPLVTGRPDGPYGGSYDGSYGGSYGGSPAGPVQRSLGYRGGGGGRQR